MKIYNGIEELPQFKETVVSVGSFDGVHRGHRLLISRMNDLAESLGATSVIVTFDPHPREVLRGNNRLLSTTPEKLILLKEAGAEHVLVINFTQEFSQMPYDRFVKDILRGKLSATNIYVGEGHHFGKEKQGGVDSFESLGIRTHLIERLEGISSTGVREAIEQEDMQLAANLLGDKYLIIEPVEHKSKIIPKDKNFTRTIIK